MVVDLTSLLFFSLAKECCCHLCITNVFCIVMCLYVLYVSRNGMCFLSVTLSSGMYSVSIMIELWPVSGYPDQGF